MSRSCEEAVCRLRCWNVISAFGEYHISVVLAGDATCAHVTTWRPSFEYIEFTSTFAWHIIAVCSTTCMCACEYVYMETQFISVITSTCTCM